MISLGRERYERVVAEPDSLAEHPVVAEAVQAHRDEALFYEDTNHAAGGAFERLTGDSDAFYEAWSAYTPADEHVHAETDMGEDFDFDFDDAEEMRRRLPHLTGPCLGPNT